jgi:hypothetical protein
MAYPDARKPAEFLALSGLSGMSGKKTSDCLQFLDGKRGLGCRGYVVLLATRGADPDQRVFYSARGGRSLLEDGVALRPGSFRP